MTTAELNAQVDNNPTVQQAASAVAAARSKMQAAQAAKDAAWAYYLEKKSVYEGSGKLTPPGLKNQRKLLMQSAANDYDTKASLSGSANNEYSASLSVYEQIRKKVNDTIVEQAKAASAAEIAASNAKGEQSKTITSANINKTVQSATTLEAAKAKRQKMIIIGGVIFVIVLIFGIWMWKRYKK